MISVLIRELLLPALVFLFVRYLLGNLFRSRRPAAPERHPANPPPVQAGGTLHKDPVCGTYVSTDTGVIAKVKGEVVYFCSPECRSKFNS